MKSEFTDEMKVGQTTLQRIKKMKSEIKRNYLQSNEQLKEADKLQTRVVKNLQTFVGVYSATRRCH